MAKASPGPSIIAHRGASGYLPEHTLECKALAHAQGADFLEQDIVATADGVPIVFHDLFLDAMTDVRERFPGRARDDGLNYCIDFSLDEVRELEVRERRDLATGRALRPGRFPVTQASFRIPTLREELLFVQGLNRVAGRAAGIYPEIKAPSWHEEQGCDLVAAVVAELQDSGWLTGTWPVCLQCFEAGTLRELSEFTEPEFSPLIQLLPATGGDLPLDAIAGYAQGIGPALDQLWEPGRGSTGLCEAAHELGLLVHPYTFRADDLPAGFDSFEQLLRIFFCELRVDGVFTEQPDRAREWLNAQPRPQ